MSETARVAVHVPVMVEQVVEVLKAREGGIFLDCTFGGGGHTRAILEASPDAWVIAADRDGRAVERSRAWAEAYGDRLVVHQARFSQVRDVVGTNKFDGILADLGMSTDQLRESRGFSFADESLDMRMDETSGFTARELVNTASERDLFIILAEGGVGKNARNIARAIVRSRPFESASQLAASIKESQLGKRGESKVHPATVVFQALRMKVNDERSEIEALLSSSLDIVKPSGRLAVITFHSVEDQLVTGRMREWSSAGSYPASWRGPRDTREMGRILTKKPIIPDEGEISENPASRSARLRVFERSAASSFERASEK